MREVGQGGFQIEAAVAHARAVVVGRAGELEGVERRLHLGQRTGEGDGVGAVAGCGSQAGGGAQDQVALGAGVGERGMGGIAVEPDGGRDIIAETVHVAGRKTGERKLRVLVHRVGAGVGERRGVVEVGRAQRDVLGDAVVGGVDRRTVGVVGGGAAVGAGGQGAAAVVQAVVGNHADLVVAGIGIAGEGDGQRGEHRIDLGLGALHDQGVGALAGEEGAAAAGIGGAVVELRRGDEGVGVVEHLQLDADEVGFAGLDAVGQVEVGHAHAGNGRRSGAGGEGIEAGGRVERGHVVARGDFDVVGGRCRRRALSKGLRVVDRPVAVADHIAERVGRGFAAVVLVADRAAVQIGLGERRADAHGRAVEQQLAVGRGGGDAVLPLHGRIIVVAEGEMRPGHGRGRARTRHAVDGGVARRPADDGGGALLDGASLAADQFRLGKIGRRIVQRRDGDGHRHFRAEAVVVGWGHRGSARAAIAKVPDLRAVQRFEFEAVAIVFAAVVGIDQLARRQVRRGDDGRAGHHVHAVELERAMRHGAGNEEAQGLVGRVAGFVVGRRVVGIGQGDVAGRKGEAGAFRDQLARGRGDGGVVLRRGADAEGLGRG